jgi:flagellar basal body P-ring formation protein FlgA
MMLRHCKKRANMLAGGLAAGLILMLVSATGAAGQPALAVVPTQTIYPGQTISAGQLEEVEVTNPNLTGDYAQSIAQVDGQISTRTLLPGRVIYVSALHAPYLVARGTQILLVYAGDGLRLSVTGIPLKDGSVGELIQVRNADTGVTVSGTVMADGTVQVVGP